MKQVVKYRLLSIPNKLFMEMRLILDRGYEYTSINDGSKYTSANIAPIIGLSIVRKDETDENGNRVKAVWNPNDHLGMTKFNLPIMYEELHGIQQDMKKPELYTYHGKRLELNETLAENIRRVFIIGNVTIELSAVVIVQPDESRVEGIKIKFNNENSSVLLTLNELTSLIYNINHLNIDTLAMQMYQAFVDRPNKNDLSSNVNIDFPLPTVDIAPKEKF